MRSWLCNLPEICLLICFTIIFDKSPIWAFQQAPQSAATQPDQENNNPFAGDAVLGNFFGKSFSSTKNPPANPYTKSFSGIKIEKQAAGIIVTSVVEGGPADRGGILLGDIIKRINDKPLYSLCKTDVSDPLEASARCIPPFIATQNPKTALIFEIERNGETYQKTVILEAPPKGYYEAPKKIKHQTATPIQRQKTSDIDTSIPFGKPAGKFDVAVVIGNANYAASGTPNVDFALQDAQSIKQYLTKTFGYDPTNIIYLENATLTKLNEVFGTSDDYQGRLYKWVKPGQSKVFIYYVGHGAPDQQTGEGYFVPVDANPQYIRTSGYKLSTFYENIAKLPAIKKTVVIDACFSGSSANGQLLKGVSGLTARLKSEPKASVAADLLLTSAGMDQVSSWYPEKEHSLFTYFFLKGIQGEADTNKDGKITMGEMKAWLNEHVPYMARRITGNQQQPVMMGKDEDELVVYH